MAVFTNGGVLARLKNPPFSRFYCTWKPHDGGDDDGDDDDFVQQCPNVGAHGQWVHGVSFYLFQMQKGTCHDQMRLMKWPLFCLLMKSLWTNKLIKNYASLM